MKISPAELILENVMKIDTIKKWKEYIKKLTQSEEAIARIKFMAGELDDKLFSKKHKVA